jgi:hypothetical protein
MSRPPTRRTLKQTQEAIRLDRRLSTEIQAKQAMSPAVEIDSAMSVEDREAERINEAVERIMSGEIDIDAEIDVDSMPLDVDSMPLGGIEADTMVSGPGHEVEAESSFDPAIHEADRITGSNIHETDDRTTEGDPETRIHLPIVQIGGASQKTQYFIA